MPSLINFVAGAATLAVAANGAAVPPKSAVKCCAVSEEPQPLRLRDNPKRCIVESDPQPKPKDKSPFSITVEWGPCGKDDENAMLFRWNGTFCRKARARMFSFFSASLFVYYTAMVPRIACMV